jgi:hypothetical protein
MRRHRWKSYVPADVRRAQTQQKMQKLRKKGVEVQPVVIAGRKIARTFWGQAWCDHLEKFSDFANRLPRGRTYVRNGSVCHLEIAEGEVRAMVSGSRLYNVRVAVENLPRKKWKDLKERCAGQIGSLLELLQGKLSKEVMAVVTERDRGPVPPARGDDPELRLSRLGGHVQARGRSALRSRRPPGREAGAPVPAARRRP